jgi:hypothetical protein
MLWKQQKRLSKKVSTSIVREDCLDVQLTSWDPSRSTSNLAILVKHISTQTSLRLITACLRDSCAYEAVKVARTRLTKAEVGSRLRSIAAAILHVADDRGDSDLST